jgi:lipoate-protein ligase A
VTDLSYRYPDADMYGPAGADYELRAWIPPFAAVVIGRGDTPEEAVRLALAQADGIPVMQRQSGGHAVFLSPNMLAVSLVWRRQPLPDNRPFFAAANQLIITALEQLGVDGLQQRGISDIAIAGRKLVGSSIYRNRQLLFFHAIINCRENAERIARYLHFPRRSPDYRRGRAHKDFITSLRECGYDLQGELVAGHICAAKNRFPEFL